MTYIEKADETNPLHRGLGGLEGYILTGGRSSRMGRDKFQLSLDGLTFLERAIRQVESLGIPCSVVASPSQSHTAFGVPIIHDIQPGMGPLGGIYTALRTCTEEQVLILPCDVPLISGELLHLLLREAQGMDIVLPVDRSGRRHSLCAIYSTRCLPRIEEQLERGDLKVRSLLDHAGLRVKSIRLEDEGIPESTLLNVNTPQELADLLRIYAPEFKSE